MKPEIQAYIQVSKETLINEINILEAACAEASSQLGTLQKETPASLTTCAAQEAVRLATTGLKEAVSMMDVEAINAGVEAARASSDALIRAKRALEIDLREEKQQDSDSMIEALNGVVVALTASRKMYMCLAKKANAKPQE